MRHSQDRDFLDYMKSLALHGLFDQALNSKDRARAKVPGEEATSGGSKDKRFLCMFCNKGFSCSQKVVPPVVPHGRNPSAVPSVTCT
jgi:hypothetical protein